MASLLADEDFEQRVVEALRGLGHDVITVREEGLANLGTPDPAVLAHATSLGRAVLTHNRTDFVHLHGASAAHAGIIAVSRDRDSQAAALRIHTEIVRAGGLVGLLLRVNRPA
jgi:hypothetical protein